MAEAGTVVFILFFHHQMPSAKPNTFNGGNMALSRL